MTRKRYKPATLGGEVKHLHVKLPAPMKRMFAEACRKHGVTPSHWVRAQIEAQIEMWEDIGR